MADGSDRIESRLKEERRFHPSAAFVDRARLSSHHAYNALYRQSIDEPEEFWREQTIDLSWRTPWTAFSEWSLTGNAAKAKFFLGAKLNVTESCLDRHLSTSRRTKAAIIWEGEPGDTRTLTYFELCRQVIQAAAALTELGVEAGRPSRDLHGDGPRGRRGDARVRADRGDALGRLRRASARTRSAIASTTAVRRSS